MKYPLASTTWDQKEYAAIQEVMDTGMFTMGKKVEVFEQDFAQKFGSKYAIMVNSGSSANLIAVAALFFKKDNPLKAGDQVIVPAVSWSTTYHPLQQYGLHCKFVDIDLHTLNYDLDKLAEAVNDKTRMIMTVNLLGNPNDFDAIYQIIGERKIYLMEDNCESMGATYKNKQAGTIGDLGTYSSFFSHHISTMEGGVVVTNNEELYHIMLSLRSHGWTRHLPKKNLVTGTKSDDLFEESFKFVLPGFNLRPGELHAAVGIEQLKKLDEFVLNRRKNAITFRRLFSNHPTFIIQQEIGSSSWFGFSMVICDTATVTRQELVQLLTENEIECRPIVSGNFLKNPVLKYYNYSVHDSTPNADLIEKNGLFIGNHHYDLTQELEFLKQLLG